MTNELSDDPQRHRLREILEDLLLRTEKARSWEEQATRLRGLVNHEGFVPVRARLAREDLDFLAGARDTLLMFVELGLRLLDLHQPRDAGGITSDAAHPILRCRSCMWRWPCPTFRAMSEAFHASLTLPADASPAQPADASPAQLTEPPPGTPPELDPQHELNP